MNKPHRYQFSRTLSAWEAMQLERAIEPNGGRVIIKGYSVIGAVARYEDIAGFMAAVGRDLQVEETPSMEANGIEIPRCVAMWCTHMTAPGKEYCAHHAAFERRATCNDEDVLAKIGRQS